MSQLYFIHSHIFVIYANKRGILERKNQIVIQETDTILWLFLKQIFQRFALNPLINRGERQRVEFSRKKIIIGTYPSTIIISDFHVNSWTCSFSTSPTSHNEYHFVVNHIRLCNVTASCSNYATLVFPFTWMLNKFPV